MAIYNVMAKERRDYTVWLEVEAESEGDAVKKALNYKVISDHEEFDSTYSTEIISVEKDSND